MVMARASDRDGSPSALMGYEILEIGGIAIEVMLM